MIIKFLNNLSNNINIKKKVVIGTLLVFVWNSIIINSEKLAASSEELSSHAEVLNEIVNRFKTEEKSEVDE